MMCSEGARRLIALCAVVAGIGAQSVITSPADANQSGVVQTYGVRLLGSGLAAPAWPTTEHRALELPPPVAEPQGSAAVLFEPAAQLDPSASVKLPARRWLSVPAEFERMEMRRSWPENRDSSGALIQLTENDVLIPARRPY